MKKLLVALFLIISLAVQATTWYISPTGSNSNNGSSGSPWLSLSYANAQSQVVSGDIIHVNAGTYTESLRCVVKAGVSIEGAGQSNTIIKVHYNASENSDGYLYISGGTNGNNVSGITFDGDNLTGTHAAFIGRSNVNIYNCTFKDFLIQGVRYEGAASNNTLHDCILSNSGGVTNPSPADDSRQPTLFISDQTNFQFYNSVLTQTRRSQQPGTGYNMTGDGIWYEGGNRDVRIHHNTLTGLYPSDLGWCFLFEAWDYDQVSGIGYGFEFDNNIIIGEVDMGTGPVKGTYSYSMSFHHNIVGDEVTHGPGVAHTGLEFEEKADGVEIYCNTFKHLDRALYFSHNGMGVTGAFSNFNIHTNIFRDIPYSYSNVTVGSSEYAFGCAINFAGSNAPSPASISNITIRNNTIVAYPSAPGGVGIWMDTRCPVTNIIIQNNIISGFADSPIRTVDGGSTWNGLVAQKNIYWGNGTNSIVLTGITITGTVTNDGGIISNPLFLSATDFHLQPGSPAINAGINVGLTTDYEGKPITGSPDVGAYEYGQVVITDYYVATNGSDSNPGTSSSPFLTVKHACDVATTAGETIHVGAGTFTETAQCNLYVGVNLVGQGVTSVIRTGYAANPLLSLVSSTEGTNGNQSISYLKFDGNNLTGYEAIWVRQRANVKIHDCTFINFYRQGVVFAGRITDGEPTTYATGNEFYSNTITNCSLYETYGRGALCVGGQTGMLIHDNIITQTGRTTGTNGYCIKYWALGYLRGMRIYNNTLTREPYDGATFDFSMELWHIQGAEIYNNTISNCTDLNFLTKGTYSYSVDFHDNIVGPAAMNTAHFENGVTLELGVADAIVRNNYFKNLFGAVQLFGHAPADDFSNIHVYYNVVDKARLIYWQAAATTTVNNVNIWNNTVTMGSTNLGDGIELPDIGPATNISIRNNIVQGFNRSPVFAYNQVSGASIATVSYVDNIFYLNGNSNNPLYNGITPTGVTTTNTLKVNPVFVSATDLHLQSTSPAINAGISVGLTVDKDGHAIVGLPDIGAYEYASVIPPPVLVTSITVSGAGGATTITTNDGTLQLSAAVLPANATDKTITWSWVNGTGTADVSATGLVTAITNGTITARATANDGSGVYGTLVITISNQPVVKKAVSSGGHVISSGGHVLSTP